MYLFFPCLNHRLDLAVSDAVADVAAMNHFKTYLESLYVLFSQSSKYQHELSEVSSEIGCCVLKLDVF